MPKSQSSLEYLIIVALTFAIIVPTTYLFFNYSRDTTTRMAGYRIDTIGKSIISSAESIYYSGGHSKTIIDFDMPDGVDSIKIISNRELVFNLTIENTANELVFFTGINITTTECADGVCTFPSTLSSSGIKRLKIESINSGSQVLLNQE